MMNSGPYFFQSGGGGGAAGSGMTGLAYATFVPTGSWTLNTTYTGGYSRLGEYMFLNIKLAMAGAPNGTGSLTVNLPAGFTMDTGKVQQGNSAPRSTLLGSATYDDASANSYDLSVSEFTPQSILLAIGGIPAAGASFIARLNVSATLPVTMASGDTVTMWAAVPILGWLP